MGVVRVAALALCAPLLAMPTTAMASSDHPSSGPTSSESASADLRAPARVHLLAVPVYWGAMPPAYPSTDRMRQELDATAAFYDRVSRGHEVLRYRVTPWIRVRTDTDTMCNHLAKAARLTETALVRTGYRPGRFNRLMLFTEQCNGAVSAAQQAGRVSWIRFRNPGAATLIHELGHNLGLDHANGLVCRQDGRRVTLGGSCRTVEYGDSWDAMGHSRASFSVPVLQRLGWAGTVATAGTGGWYRITDVERSGNGLQALRVPAGDDTTYWVEYQPKRLAEVGRTIPGVMIRRQVGDGPVQILDASPGNPTSLPFPDADLTNAALPVGSSFTTPEGVRITTVAVTGRVATVEVVSGEIAGAPAAPRVDYAARLGNGSYRLRWERPDDNGQVLLGYRVTSVSTGTQVYLRSAAGARTSLVVPGDAVTGAAPAFTVEALNQMGWSTAGSTDGRAYGPLVKVTSPQRDAAVKAGFQVAVTAEADGVTGSPPVRVWADVDGTACTSAEGPGPYTLECRATSSRRPTVTVHVENADGAVTDVAVPVRVQGRI